MRALSKNNKIRLFKLFCFIFKKNEDVYKYGKYLVQLSWIPHYLNDFTTQVSIYDSYEGCYSFRLQKKVHQYYIDKTIFVNYYEKAKDHKHGW